MNSTTSFLFENGNYKVIYHNLNDLPNREKMRTAEIIGGLELTIESLPRPEDTFGELVVEVTNTKVIIAFNVQPEVYQILLEAELKRKNDFERK